MKKSIASLLLLGFILFGCSNPVNVGPDLTPGIDSKSMVTSRAWTQVDGLITGELGPGASYAIYIPPGWNGGDLVLYAHGYVFPPDVAPPEVWDVLKLILDVEPPQPKIYDDMLLALLGEGYAVAYSTFSEDGYALKDGVIRTRQLRGIFTSKVGKPAHTYLIGQSLGGAISLMLAEKNPNLFSGALLVSGFVGGGQTQIDYVANAYLLFDHYFPGILYPILEIPKEYTLQELEALAMAVAGALLADMATGGTQIAQMVSVLADGIPVFQARPGVPPDVPIEETLETILSPLVFSLFGINDILDRTHDHVMFDNSDTEYFFYFEETKIPVILDEDKRFEATPDAANYLKHWYEPTGKLKIPVLTLHNEYDAVVPYYHEAEYASGVQEAGFSDMLRQRGAGFPYTYPFGHCKFTLEEIGTALGELEFRVENGYWLLP